MDALALFFIAVFGALCFFGGYVRGKELAERKALLVRLEEILIDRKAIVDLLRPSASDTQPRALK